jgi:deoxyribodipyrimidine photo-lyase
LRLSDNQALTAALSYADIVMPVFILDPILWESSKVGIRRKAFLAEGLRHLAESLRARGSALTIRIGNPAHKLAELIDETGATVIFAEEDYSPYARQRDANPSENVPLYLVPGLTVHHPLQVVNPKGRPYTVFTPFSKIWKSLPPPIQTLPAPLHLPSPPEIPSEPLPDFHEVPSAFVIGESEAQKRLARFTQGAYPPIFAYHHHRDRPDLNATSTLSPYLRFGMRSARQTMLTALKLLPRAPSPDARKGVESWLNELIWRA